MTDEPTASDGVSIETLDDPESLRDGTVPVEEVNRVVSAAQFEGLREHYDDIAGVVQVGITDEDGRVLLQGSPEDGDWAPPGSPVEPGRTESRLPNGRWNHRLGSMSRPTMWCCSNGSSLVRRTARRPSPRGESRSAPPSRTSGSCGTPRSSIIRISPEHKRTFAWFDAVPEDANDNHVEHIERFIE